MANKRRFHTKRYLSICCGTLFLMRRPFYRDAARHVATNTTRLANGKPTASLSRRGTPRRYKPPPPSKGNPYSLLNATQHATSLLTPPRLANGNPYSLSPTRFTTPSTSEASGRAASSNRPSGESSSRRGVCNFSIPSICNSWVRSALLLRQYSPCRPCR